jgi:hypothetical protein
MRFIIIGAIALAAVLAIAAASYLARDVAPVCVEAAALGAPTESTARAVQKKEEFICRLDRFHDWYARAKNFYGTTWYAGGLAAAVLGALTSILVALGFAGQPGWRRSITIVLPALAALISTALVQFRVREIWELREIGRIDVLRLEAAAERIPETNAQEILDEIYALEIRLIDVEQRQAQSFYGYFGAAGQPDSVADERAAPERDAAKTE